MEILAEKTDSSMSAITPPAVRDNPIVLTEVDRDDRAVNVPPRHPAHEAVVEGTVGVEDKQAHLLLRHARMSCRIRCSKNLLLPVPVPPQTYR